MNHGLFGEKTMFFLLDVCFLMFKISDLFVFHGLFGKKNKAFLGVFFGGEGGLLMICFGGGFFLEGFVGFLVAFSKGDGWRWWEEGESGERERKHITLKKVVFFGDVGGGV